MAACSSRPPPDEIWLHYSAGSMSTQKFVECIPANTKGPGVVNDKLFAIPTNARTWNIQPPGTPGADDNTPIKVGTKPTTVDSDGKPVAPGTPGAIQQPGPEVIVWVNTDFYIRTFCGADNKDKNSSIVKFWETLGRRYQISTDDAKWDLAKWKDLVNATYLPALKSSMQTAARKYDADTLDSDNNSAWSAMEREIGTTLLAALKAKPGGEFLCGAQYANDSVVTWNQSQVDPNTGDQLRDAAGKPLPDVPVKGQCPPIKVDITAIDYADPKVQQARADVYAAKQRAEAQLTEARAKKQAADLLRQGGEQSIEIQRLQTQLEIAKACAANPNCTLIVNGAAGNTNVNVSK